MKDMVKLGCKNAKLFLTEPLLRRLGLLGELIFLVIPLCASILKTVITGEVCVCYPRKVFYNQQCRNVIYNAAITRTKAGVIVQKKAITVRHK